MRRPTFNHEGYEVTAEDILGDDREELATYRRINPRPVVHQLRFAWPDHAAEEYEQLVEARGREWRS